MLYATKLNKQPVARTFVGTNHLFIEASGESTKAKPAGSKPAGKMKPTTKSVNGGWQIISAYMSGEFRIKGLGSFVQDGGFRAADFHSITTDLKVYQRGEVATVFAFWPSAAGQKVLFGISHGPTKLREVEVEIDQFGMGSFTVADLQVGEYNVRTVETWDMYTTFTVAEYTQSPLVARLSEVEKVTDKVRAVLSLSTFGTHLPVGTTVLVELKPAYTWYFERDNLPLVKEYVVGENGQVSVEFKLPAHYYGGMSLTVTDKNRPSLTAEAAIPGLRSSYQAESFLFNNMGKGVSVSSVASPGSNAVRGLHLSDGPISNDPIVPVAVVTDEVQFKALAPCEALVIGVFNPMTGEVTEYSFENVAAGTVTKAIPFSGPWAQVAVAAWVKVSDTEVKPFEGVTNFVKPEKVALNIVAPNEVKPGGKLRIDLRADGTKQGTVAVTVKASVLLPNGEHLQTLVEELLAGIRRSGVQSGFVTLKAKDAKQPWWCRGGALLEGMPDEAMAMPAAMSVEGTRKGGLESASEDEEEAPTAREEQQITVLFSGLVSLEDGVAIVEIDAPNAIADVTVSAFLATDGDWAEAPEKRVLIVSDLFAKMSTPAPVAPEDIAILPVVVHSKTGKAHAIVYIGSSEVPFAIDGNLILPGEEFSTPAVLQIAVRAGETVWVELENSDGATDSVMANIPMLGKYYYDKVTPLAVLPGMSLTTGMFGVKYIELIPGLKRVFMKIAEAIASKKVLAYDCCGQTAAKFWPMLQSFSEGNKEMRWALMEGFEHMLQLLAHDGRFYFYKGSAVANVENYYAKSAVWDLLALQIWVDHPAIVGDPEVLRIVKKLVQMGKNAQKAYGLKSKKITSFQEAFVALTLSVNEAAKQASKTVEAVKKFLLSKLIKKDGIATLEKNAWGWYRQSDLAYAAVICLKLGMFAEGYQLANQVFGTFDRYGMPYGYLELTPVMAMLSELDKLNEESEVIVNGRTMTTREVFDLNEEIESLEVVSGAAFVRVTEVVLEDIFSYHAAVQVSGQVTNPTGEVARVGDKLELTIHVEGMQYGDVVAIMLPSALAFLKGGAQIRTQESDLRWWNTLKVDLVAVGDTRLGVEPDAEVGRQTIYVVVRNMDDQGRFAVVPMQVMILPL